MAQAWHYAGDDGRRRGPVPRAELDALIAAGTIMRDTLVWNGTMPAWVQAGSVPELEPAFTGVLAAGTAVHPWRRFFAKSLDMALFGVVFALAMQSAFGIAPPQDSRGGGEILWQMATAFAFIFFDASLLATMGGTPGRVLYRIQVRTRFGARLSHAQALGRAFGVWWRGQGLGIPIVSLFTAYFGYKRLTREGISAWDEDAGSVVLHGPMDGARWALVWLVWIGAAVTIVLLARQGMV